MNLRELAEKSLELTLEDSVNGWGWSITVVDPADNSADITGQSGDIHTLIDPDTGQAVSGRFAHVSLRISTLADKGLSIPVGVVKKNQKPWRFRFNDISGQAYTFSVEEARPDRTIGLVTCSVELYKEA